MYVVKTPKILKKTYPKCIWDIPSVEKNIYLTFDDGPTPKVTDWVLDELTKYKAKATFFCIGKNAVENPELFARITDEKHTIGNHTFSHSNGWKTKEYTYLKDVIKCQQVVKTKLFRPPYGKLTRVQTNSIHKKFKIVMWDVLSADFDTTITPEKCLQNVLKNTSKGSIVVFHDSKKAEKNLKFVLPKMLKHFSELGFEFKAIN
ncbi:MAG: polysaccharide deacetylase family protein [Bacteroidetes bacterium]|nr:polysaccharide deacetylase family protein [Bacteroidota bacterium]